MKRYRICLMAVLVFSLMFTALALGSETVERLPATVVLKQNYPNPFNPSTTIEYDLREAARVELGIYNIVGQEIALLVAETQEAGSYRVRWDGTDGQRRPLPGGVYFYQLTATTMQPGASKVSELTRRMILLK